MRSWSSWPYRIMADVAVLIVAWVHGCIGLYFWLRMKAFYKRAAPFLLAAAVLVPTLALLGFYQAGRTVVADSDDAEWRSGQSFAAAGRHGGPATNAGSDHRLFPDRLSRPARICRCWPEARARCTSAAAA